MTLDQVNSNSTVVIKKVEGDRPIRRRLMDLGLLPGAEVSVLKVAPLGDPIEILVNNTSLTVRKKDARNIQVQ